MPSLLYYVEKPDETLQTSNRFEAAEVAAEWVRRGYVVDTVVIEVSDDAVREADMAHHARVLSGTGNAAEQRELGALCRGLRGME